MAGLYHTTREAATSMGMELERADELIRQAVREMAHIQPCEVTAGARKAVEAKLRKLPELCEALEQAEGLEAVLLAHEVKKIKRVLESISDDPYYQAIPAKYFQGAKDRTAAILCACDKATVWRNRSRLLDILAFRLFGVDAWDETKTW